MTGLPDPFDIQLRTTASRAMTQVYGLGNDFSIVIIQLDWIIQSKVGAFLDCFVPFDKLSVLAMTKSNIVPSFHDFEYLLKVFLILIVIVVSYGIDTTIDVRDIEEPGCAETDTIFYIFIFMVVIVGEER